MTKKIMPIHVEDLAHLVAEEEGEQMRDQELSQQIEELIELMDMELRQEPQNEDTDLIL